MSLTKKRSLVVLLFSVAMLSMSMFAASPAQAGPFTQAHFHGGFIDIADGTIEVDINDCPEGSGEDGLVLFDLVKAGNAATGTFHCTDIFATGPLGDAIVDLLCTITFSPWDESPSEWDVSITCLMHIFVQTVLGDFLCNAHGSWMMATTDGASWHEDNAGPGFDPIVPTDDCPELIAGLIDDFIDMGVDVLLDFLFT